MLKMHMFYNPISEVVSRVRSINTKTGELHISGPATSIRKKLGDVPVHNE